MLSIQAWGVFCAESMLNLYEETRSDPRYNKLAIGDLLFVEYTCPIEEKSVGVWAHTDYLVHVISGKKTWHTTERKWVAEGGQTLFFKKGAAIVEQFFDKDFCLLLFFIPDYFVRETVREYAGELRGNPVRVDTPEPAIRVNNDAGLSVFFQSMLSYFSGTDKPPEPLLKLKLKELIVSILLGRNNPELSSYFQSLASSNAPSVGEIMEANFRYNLSLEHFAELCHRSLSSFKRDFTKHYNEPPGRWLLKKRLEYSAVLLRTGDMNISQIMFECGFEDLSHFSRVFKDRFGLSPTQFRDKADVHG